MVAAGYLEPQEKIDNTADKVKQTLEANPDMIDLWDKFINHEEYQELFMQVRDFTTLSLLSTHAKYHFSKTSSG